MLIKIRIKGITPLLCNKFTDSTELKENLAKSVMVGQKPSPFIQAENKLYMGLDGKPMIPQPNVLKCIIESGKYFKCGKNKITTQKSSIIPACVSIDVVEIPIIHQDPWAVDTRSVRIPSTGGRILCHRPIFHDWELEFEVELDTTLLSVNVFKEIIDAAGKRIGLGDFRPDCKGPFGKFTCVLFEEVKCG